MNNDWLLDMPGVHRLLLVALAVVFLTAAIKYEKPRPNSFRAFVLSMFAIAFLTWSSWFCLGAFVKPFNPSMEFMNGK